MAPRLTTVFIVMILCAQGGTAIAEDAIATHRKASVFVFTVEATGPTGLVQGSAVAVVNGRDPKTNAPSDTWLATNEHVVRGVINVVVRQGTNSYVGTVDYRNASLDLALIKVNKIVFPTAVIVDLKQIQVGQRVFAIGSPLGLESSITEGIVSGKRLISGVSVIQTTAPISPGNSGGGLFDAGGRLLGITTFRLRDGQNLNFAIEGELLIHIGGAAKAYELLKFYFESAKDPPYAQSILGLFDSRLETWLATVSEEDQRRRYEEVIDVFDRLLFARNIDPDLAHTRIATVMQAYMTATSDSAPASTSPSPPRGAAATIVLSCELDGPQGAKRNETFTVDFDRKLVNGKAAQIFDDRIVLGEGLTRLEIHRFTGAVVFYSEKLKMAQTAGMCKRAAEKQF